MSEAAVGRLQPAATHKGGPCRKLSYAPRHTRSPGPRKCCSLRPGERVKGGEGERGERERGREAGRGGGIKDGSTAG